MVWVFLISLTLLNRPIRSINKVSQDFLSSPLKSVWSLPSRTAWAEQSRALELACKRCFVHENIVQNMNMFQSLWGLGEFFHLLQSALVQALCGGVRRYLSCCWWKVPLGHVDHKKADSCSQAGRVSGTRIAGKSAEQVLGTSVNGVSLDFCSYLKVILGVL